MTVYKRNKDGWNHVSVFLLHLLLQIPYMKALSAFWFRAKTLSAKCRIRFPTSLSNNFSSRFVNYIFSWKKLNAVSYLRLVVMATAKRNVWAKAVFEMERRRRRSQANNNPTQQLHVNDIDKGISCTLINEKLGGSFIYSRDRSLIYTMNLVNNSTVIWLPS